MSELRKLVGDLLRDARGQLERGPVLARADLEALLPRVREAGDERLLERRGKLARVRDGLRAERRRELVLEDRTDGGARDHRAELLHRVEDAGCRAGELRLEVTRREVVERGPDAGQPDPHEDQSREQRPATAVGADGPGDVRERDGEEREPDEQERL